jgi:hypothetical protein
MLKHLLRRLRGFLQAEMMAELAAMRSEMAGMRAEMARRDELAPLARQMEAALLTIENPSARDGVTTQSAWA